VADLSEAQLDSILDKGSGGEEGSGRVLRQGSRVEIQGLVNKPEFNGELTVVQSYCAKRGRYQVRLKNMMVMLKQSNLQVIEDKRTRAWRVVVGDTTLRDELQRKSRFGCGLYAADNLRWRRQYIEIRGLTDRFIAIREHNEAYWFVAVGKAPVPGYPSGLHPHHQHSAVFGEPLLDRVAMTRALRMLQMATFAPAGEPTVIESWVHAGKFGMYMEMPVMLIRALCRKVEHVESMCNRRVFGRQRSLLNKWVATLIQHNVNSQDINPEATIFGPDVASEAGHFAPAWIQGITEERERKLRDKPGCVKAISSVYSMKAAHSAEQCGGCGGQFTARELKRCVRCRSVSYCSIACQKDAWKDHKVECKLKKT